MKTHIMEMKKLLFVFLMSIVSFMAFSQTKILLAVGGRTMTASMVDNAATRDLLLTLQQGPIIVRMSDYGGFEKVGALPRSFPTSNSQITTEPGDIMLYQGNNIVIFYGSNSWSYTRLGKIDDADAEEVRSFLGEGPIELSLSLVSSSAIEISDTGSKAGEAVYDLTGRKVNADKLAPGIYIMNGKKTQVRHLKNC